MLKTVMMASAAVVALSSPALAQTDDEAGFNGLYVGGSFGYSVQNNDVNSRINFDRNRDGNFSDTVVTAAGANAFSPGSCNGAATSATPGTGCDNDKDGIDFAGRVGFDIQRGNLVFGLVGEAGRTRITDSVSAFSTTPASYTMTRDVRFQAAVRARAGYTPDNKTLFYGTGGGSYARVGNYFSTTNTANAFATNGRYDLYGYQAGGGIEHMFGPHFSIGLEYLYNRFKDRKGVVRVSQGSAPLTNPFILGGGGTDFQRSDNRFSWHTGRVTASFRF